MPTPSGTISLSDVNIELGNSSNAPISMNDSAVRELAGVGASGTTISMDNLRGKSNLNSPPWYIIIKGNNAANPYNAGGIIVDEVTTQAGNVLSVMNIMDPVLRSAGARVFSLQNPNWSPWYNNIVTNSNGSAFYYVNDGSSYVQVVTREFTWDYQNNEMNWYNDYVKALPGFSLFKYRVTFGNFSYGNVVGGSVSDIGEGTYANPSPTPGGTGAAHSGKPYNIAKFTWDGTSIAGGTSVYNIFHMFNAMTWTIQLGRQEQSVSLF